MRVALALALLAGLPVLAPVQALPFEGECGVAAHLYCALGALWDAAVACAPVGDGSVECTARASARVEATGPDALPGEGRLRWEAERVTCPRPDACHQVWDDHVAGCAWASGGGCGVAYDYEQAWRFVAESPCVRVVVHFRLHAASHHPAVEYVQGDDADAAVVERVEPPGCA